MKCRYCGHENPEGETFCQCGRPLGNYSTPSSTVSGADQSSPFAFQTLDSVKVRKRLPIAPLIFLLAVLIGVGIFLLIRFLDEKKINDEGSWEKLDKAMYSITLPGNLKEEEIEKNDSGTTLLDLYASRYAAVKVYIHLYSTPEVEKYGNMTDAKTFAENQQARTLKINGEVVPYQPREGANYAYLEYKTHEEDLVGKSDDVWMIEAIYPTPSEFFLVQVFCDNNDKDEYRDSMFKWLDSFKGH